jgi:hypothetical protein
MGEDDDALATRRRAASYFLTTVWVGSRWGPLSDEAPAELVGGLAGPFDGEAGVDDAGET